MMTRSPSLGGGPRDLCLYRSKETVADHQEGLEICPASG